MMPSENHSSADAGLDRLLQTYREATEFDDAGADFMPSLWQRIESRRRNTQRLERLARIFSSGAVAVAVLAGLFVALSPQMPQEESWVENLANDHLARAVSYYEPLRLAPESTPAADAPPPVPPGK